MRCYTTITVFEVNTMIQLPNKYNIHLAEATAHKHIAMPTEQRTG